MNLICAQPDKPLFIWQLRTLLHSLINLGIAGSDVYLLILLERGQTPSAEIKALQTYANVIYYPDRPGGRLYAASSKPYLFARFWEEFPESEHRHFLFIESDMIVYRKPQLPLDDKWYWSDASDYLETGQYEHLLGYAPIQGKAFGFHAWGKGADSDYWYRIERESQQLYLKMNEGKISANRWICEMRAWMWNSAARFENQISKELLFNDGHGPRKSGATLYHHLDKKIFKKRHHLLEAPHVVPDDVHPSFSARDYLQAIRNASSSFKPNGTS